MTFHADYNIAMFLKILQENRILKIRPLRKELDLFIVKVVRSLRVIPSQVG